MTFKTSEEIESELCQAEKSFGVESELYMRERDNVWLSKKDYEKMVEELKRFIFHPEIDRKGFIKWVKSKDGWVNWLDINKILLKK